MTEEKTPTGRRRRRTRGGHAPATEAAEAADAILKADAEKGAGETPELFATAAHQKGKGFPKAPDLQRGFQTIVTDLFASGYDPKKEWDAIKAGIEIKDALTPQRLKVAANGQEKIADRAHQLFIVTKVEVQAYMRETEGTYGAIRTAATKLLEMEKASGARTKQITDADVRSECARAYPEEWREINARRERAEGMLKHIENLALLAKSRCYTVSNLAHPGSTRSV